MMDREIKLLLEKVQISRASHQKNVKLLENIYKKAHYDRFRNIFIGYLRKAILKKVLKNEYIERTLDFMANFVSVISLSEEVNEDTVDSIDSTPSHTFLKDIIEETLEYHDNGIEAIRYHACLFVQLILNYLGNQVTLDNDICDAIQDAMLERTMDSKSVIRLHAIIALARLQDPSNKDCPVINAYLSLMKDPNARIRAEVIKIIAPAKVHNVAMHIKERLRDVDYSVRSNTFKRIAELSPRFFKIVDRQEIMKSGIIESNEVAKKAFTDYLLPKWLNFYERNFVLLLNSIKFDAEEADLINTEEISKRVLNIYMSCIPMEDITKSVPVNGEKLIRTDDLSLETVLLWNFTVTYLRKSEDLEEHLEELVPELTPFCNYIESMINDFHKKTVEEYQKLDYYSMLYYLFGMAEQYDFTDEVGRKTLYKLVMKLLKQERIQFRLTKKLVEIAYALTNKSEDFTNIICEMISEIREPLVVVEAPPAKQTDDITKNFQIAALKVKLDRLEIDLEMAKDKQEFLQANDLKQQITHLRKELEEVMKPVAIPTTEMVKTVRDDPSTICWCLDLLIALLELPEIKKVTPSLLTVKETFVMPLLDSAKIEINWRVLNVLALYATLDPSLAEALIKILCIPIITYRVLPNHVKEAILIAIKTVPDMFSLYGSEIFGQSESSSDGPQTRRRLYTEENDESLTNPNNFNLESIVDILLDMMDDDNSEIIETAALALTKLILNGFPVTSAFVTRIILKWYNPVTGNISGNLQQLLGIMIGNYSNNVKGARDIVAKAVIPILTSIAGAPSTSPLSEVDMDNLIHFLAAITNPDINQVDVVNTHVSLAHSLCHEILKKKNQLLVHFMTKMLTALEIPSEDKLVLEEVITQAQMTLDEDVGLDKQSKKYVEKFVQNLKGILERDYTNRDSILQMESTDVTTENNTRSETVRTSVSAVEKTVVGEKDTENDNTTISNAQNENLAQKKSDTANKVNSSNLERNCDENGKTNKGASVNMGKPAEKSNSQAGNEKRKGPNKQSVPIGSRKSSLDSNKVDEEKQKVKSSNNKRSRRDRKNKAAPKAGTNEGPTSSSGSDVENRVAKKQKVSHDDQVVNNANKRRKQGKNKNHSPSTSDTESEPKRQRLSLSMKQALSHRQIAVRMKRMSSGTITRALKKRNAVFSSPKPNSKMKSPKANNQTLPIAESTRKSLQVETTSNKTNTSQSIYDETPRPNRRNGSLKRLSQILSTSSTASSQTVEKPKGNSKGSSRTSSPTVSVGATPKNTRKNGLSGRLSLNLIASSEGSTRNVQKSTKKSNLIMLMKRNEKRHSEGSISNKSKSSQETPRKNGALARVASESSTSSGRATPKVQRTPSALDILNKNMEKRNSGGNQREIHVPKRFSDESGRLNLGESTLSVGTVKLDDKQFNKQKAPESLQRSNSAKIQENRHLRNSPQSREKNSKRINTLRDQKHKSALGSDILREKNSQGPKNVAENNRKKARNPNNNSENTKSTKEKSSKSVNRLKKKNNSENSNTSSDSEKSPKNLKRNTKLRAKNNVISVSSDDQNQKGPAATPVQKRRQESEGSSGIPNKTRLSRNYTDTPHVKRKTIQNLLERITEASRESRTSSFRRSRSSPAVSRFDDSGDSTILHTILHEVSHNISLMSDTSVVNSSTSSTRKSLSSSSISHRSLRSDSFRRTTSGKITSSIHRSRLRKK